MNSSELWLEKYKPKKYSELLTEEKTNRSIQTWLKSWDEIVFNRPVKKVAPIMPINSGGLLSNHNYEKYIQELDYKHHKYILLTGPPGTGKTTLAEVIAHICGYDSIVINASDERNTEDLLNKIENATKVHNLNFSNGSSKRPTCLVLDEVDGINFGTDDANNVAQHIMNFIKSGGSIKYTGGQKLKVKVKRSKKAATINKLNSDAGNESNSDDEDEDKHKKEVIEPEEKEIKSSKEQIMRPIILICNDFYARSIFPFKKDALIFNLKRVDTNRLLDRLKVVNKTEKCGLSDEKLRLIIEKSEYDIRRCLNLMQFLSVSANNKELLSCIDLTQVSCIGHSDVNQSIYSLWQKLLTSINKSVSGMQFQQIITEYDSSGDYDTINDGIFVNYINSSKFLNDNFTQNLQVDNQKSSYTETDTSLFNDCQLEDLEKSLASICEITELMSFANRSLNHSNHSTDLVLAGYYSVNLESSVKRQFKQLNNQSIEYPVFFKNLWRATSQNKKMISSICFNYCHFSSTLMSEKVFLSSELPYLNQQLIPEIRDLSVDLLSTKEKRNLFFSVITLLKLGVKLNVTDHSIELIPNIMKLLIFDGGVNEHSVAAPEINYEKNFRKMLILSKESARINQLRTIHLNTQDALNHQAHADDFNYYYSTDKAPQNATTIREANMILQNKAEIKNHATNEFVRKKRTSAEQDRDYIFYVKFNEGMTNAIRRNLNFDYFMA